MTNPNRTGEHHLQIVISMKYIQDEIFHQLGRESHEKFSGCINKGMCGSFLKKIGMSYGNGNVNFIDKQIYC